MGHPGFSEPGVSSDTSCAGPGTSSDARSARKSDGQATTAGSPCPGPSVLTISSGLTCSIS
eukprot:8992325-Pyramimonas_sp.AAC.1